MEDILTAEHDRLYKLVREAYMQSLHEGIRANTLLINSNMVKVKTVRLG